MRLRDFLRDRVLMQVAQILAMVVLCGYLLFIGNGVGEVALVVVLWALGFLLYVAVAYRERKRYFDRLMKTAKGLEQKYLLSEVMEKPLRAEDRQYYALLKMAHKSMMEHITDIRHERREYKEYIEQWVHEIKTPIAAIKLTCENNKSEATRKILSELERTEDYVEQALFYARSENVEKDYLVRDTLLRECVHASVVRNKQLMLQNHVALKLGELDYRVYADGKWLEFILNQLLVNAVKYRRGPAPSVEIGARVQEGGVLLYVEDNGVGISQSDLPRVCEKGFTGKNGREGRRSTGIGLYLCQRLCDKMGLGFAIRSRQGEGTRAELWFPQRAAAREMECE